MPTRKRPSHTAAERAKCYRQRQRQCETPLYEMGYAPLRLAEDLIEAELLKEQDASDPRALGAALIRASELYVQKNRTP